MWRVETRKNNLNQTNNKLTIRKMMEETGKGKRTKYFIRTSYKTIRKTNDNL